MKDTKYAIQSHQLSKNYGKTQALHNVSISVPTGSIYGLIGPNGAGKTTLMRCLTDLIRPTAGTIQLLGQDPRICGATLRSCIGYLPGEVHLRTTERGENILHYLAQISGGVPQTDIVALAERLDLNLKQNAAKLSKGNRQKLGIIQAFMHKPELLILDEPTSGLDPLVQREFLKMVTEAQNAGQTVLLSSHVLKEIEQVADTVALLRSGQLISEADITTVRQSATREIEINVAPTNKDQALQTLLQVPGLTLHRPFGSTTIRGELSGEVDPFIKAVAQLPLIDLKLAPPDLEQAVLRQYTNRQEDTQ